MEGTVNGVTNTSTGETWPAARGSPQYLGGQAVWKHVGVSTGESSWSLRGPVVKRGAERWAEWHKGSHTLGKLAPAGPPRPGLILMHVLLAEVREFCGASLQGAALCLRAALLSSSLSSATCPVTLGSFLHEISL